MHDAIFIRKWFLATLYEITSHDCQLSWQCWYKFSAKIEGSVVWSHQNCIPVFQQKVFLPFDEFIPIIIANLSRGKDPLLILCDQKCTRTTWYFRGFRLRTVLSAPQEHHFTKSLHCSCIQSDNRVYCEEFTRN